MLGDRATPVPAETAKIFRTAGLAHLTAASGANLVLLLVLWYGLTARCRLPRYLREGLALPLVAGYAWLAGLSPSIVRASLMVGLVLILRWGRHPVPPLVGLLAAGALMLGLDPTYLWDVSFQLSCAASFAILAGAEPLSRLLTLGCPGLPPRVAGWLAVPLVATLATAPIAYAHFGSVAPWSVPANVCALPLVAIGTWLSALTTLGSLLWEPVGVILEWVTFPAVWLLVQVARLFAV